MTVIKNCGYKHVYFHKGKIQLHVAKGKIQLHVATYVQWNLSNSEPFQVSSVWWCPDWDNHHKLNLEVQISEVPL